MGTNDKTEAKKKPRQVNAIQERNGKSYWYKVGVAFANRDGGFTVQLVALPVDGKLIIAPEDSPEQADK